MQIMGFSRLPLLQRAHNIICLTITAGEFLTDKWVLRERLEIKENPYFLVEGVNK